MFHKHLHNDNGVECYRCGSALDFPWLPENESEFDFDENMEEELLFLLPNCPGPTDNPGHHWYGIGAKDDPEHLISAIECHWCGAYIGWETDLAQVPLFCSIKDNNR